MSGTFFECQTKFLNDGKLQEKFCYEGKKNPENLKQQEKI